MQPESNLVFYPPEATVPEELHSEEFFLRPLRTSDVEQDYEAVMESRDMLRRWGGGSWPTDDFTLEGNYADLALHEQEHLDRTAFTYTVLDPTGSTCLGCIYVTPLAELLRQAGAEEEIAGLTGTEAVVRFWVRSGRLADGLDQRLLDVLDEWFAREWRFSRLLLRTNEHASRQVDLFGRSRRLRYTLQVPGRAGRYLLFE